MSKLLLIWKRPFFLVFLIGDCTLTVTGDSLPFQAVGAMAGQVP